MTVRTPAAETREGKAATPRQGRTRFAPVSEFSRVLRRKIGEYSQTSGSRFADMLTWAKTAAAFGLGATAYAVLMAAGPDAAAPVQLALVGATAFCAFLLLVFAGHDAAHGSISSSRRVNRTLVFGIFAIHGVSGQLWADRHVRLHHALPNVPGTGIDADSSNIVRLQPQRPPRFWHRFQMIYAPLLYLLGQLQLVWFEDFRDFRRMRKQDPARFGGAGPLAEFAATKAVHLALAAGLPVLIGGFAWTSVLLGYLMATAAVSFCFAVLVIGTHVSDRAAFPAPDSNGRLPCDWAELQLVTSIDWAPRSRFFAELTGGANAHTAHHLFPAWAHNHASRLAQIVIEAARECGLPYRATSFQGMVAAHLRHLRAMSRPA
ncbi:MAG: fatty acid desaturase family protein [Minwuia sp.]|uniref:fatty acid desaturase family protein n=1 Tax=Minwuia sp. TaxID=2493630 RepID=UPI003A8BCA4A